jgi:sterol desaturase/sphingolipid hydroxylase (fatty acid hydroxylase superfamily)
MKMEYQRHTSVRMFETPLLEWGSRVHPSIPFVFYIPVVLATATWGFVTHRTSPVWFAAFFPVGWLIWDVLEYVIHRGFFHWEGNGPFTRRLHQIAHGYHHMYPDDADRLVMPLGASLPLAALIAFLLASIGQPQATLPVFCGIVCSYMFYDFTHWSTHSRSPKTAWGKAIRAHHMAHHFACPDKNFGISHRWIDKLVGSLRVREKREE